MNNDTTQCIKITMQDDPMKVLKGCSFLLSELNEDAHENIYAYEGIKIIADLMTDAVSRVDEQMQDRSRSN